MESRGILNIGRVQLMSARALEIEPVLVTKQG